MDRLQVYYNNIIDTLIGPIIALGSKYVPPNTGTALLKLDNDYTNIPIEGQPFLTKTKLHTL